MVKERCRRCHEKVYDNSYMVMHAELGYSHYIDYCCSQECCDIIKNELYDQYCIKCDEQVTRETISTYICNICIKHQENEDNNVTCALCDNNYDKYFKFDNNINAYVCEYCRKPIKQYLLNKDKIRTYIELENN